MMWPDWLTEGRIALLVAGLSALFTGGGLLYTRQLARNDSARMRRKPPIVEIAHRQRIVDLEGWSETTVVVRNQEPVSILISAVSVVGKNRMIATREMIYSDYHPVTGARTLNPNPEKQVKIAVSASVAPTGTKTSGFPSPSDATYLVLFTYGVASAADLRVSWAWADGQK